MNARWLWLALALVFLGTVAGYDTRTILAVKLARERDREWARRANFLDQQSRLQAQAEAARLQAKPKSVRSQAPDRFVAANQGSAFDGKQLIASDPALRSKYLDLFRAGLDVQYGLLFQMLHLSPQAEAALKDLLAERTANNLQVAEEAADRGMNTDDPEMKAFGSQLNAESWRELKQLLGPPGMATLKAYWNEWPAVNVTRQLAGNLPVSDLTATQGEQLVQVIAASSQRQANGIVLPDTVDVAKAVTAATPILDAQQLITLSAVLQSNEAKAHLKKLN